MPARSTPLTRLVRPHVAIITTIEPVHLEFFGSLDAIADAKAEIFLGLEPGGAAVINRDNPQFARLAASAKGAGVARVVSFGEHAEAEARLLKCALQADCSTVRGAHSGCECHLQARCAGPACRAQLACGARRRGARRRRSGARCARARAIAARDRARRARDARAAGRRRAADRRELQRQSGLDAGGAGAARAGGGRPARPAHRGPGRHARARAARCRSPPRARRAGRRARRRSGVLLSGR